jgi:hypothetical protein
LRCGGALATFHNALSLRAAQGIPLKAGQVNSLPFLWFVSLGKQRNEQTININLKQIVIMKGKGPKR